MLSVGVAGLCRLWRIFGWCEALVSRWLGVAGWAAIMGLALRKNKSGCSLLFLVWDLICVCVGVFILGVESCMRINGSFVG